MSQLSAQSIHALCNPTPYLAARGYLPMISPFLAETKIINGKSAGLSSASYDIRIAHDLTLGVHPGYALRWALLTTEDGDSATKVLNEMRALLRASPAPCRALGQSVESFVIPDDVAGYVCDKSTYARLHVSLFNTLFDPGFRGVATLEIVNLGDQEVVIKAGDPICQLVFHWLDKATDRPYKGKYQDQPARVVGARYAQPDGTFTEHGDLNYTAR